jgi:hypothetical protein
MIVLRFSKSPGKRWKFKNRSLDKLNELAVKELKEEE